MSLDFSEEEIRQAMAAQNRAQRTQANLDQYAGNQQAGILGQIVPEPKPLEDITRIADDLQHQAEALDEYLERFNGPRPTSLTKGEAAEAPRCYRDEIERLDTLVRRIGSITDLIGRLG